MAMKTKVGYGKEENISAALEAKKVDEGDFVVAHDTKHLAFIKPDGTLMYFKSKPEIFTTKEAAEEYIKTDSSATPGEIIMVLQDGKYAQYMIQPGTEGGNLEIKEPTVDSSIPIVEF